ncbi:Cytochrome b/b6 domain protein [Sulfolobus islandicus L.S.2.15]|jgi:quinol-cytochrome oxidoreductase complex cytochrome b subunit|uniref:Cytochrome b/b6 domain protein n=3 Tax=Saccharolobus islandicus TaxID=43080 RepID=C3MLY1_SACI2|nr:proton pump complex cytochrome B SoxC [Sulfolobus islandicus]ACP36615.1 Cytochrome b/b6 domain protein [Sulfolobus islandicus L.S.2.15]ACP47430.1 Cytochrome b/b6 domain protein [Sulfolobus islandicus Y.N.15.51]ADB88425.1 Cytochrome b/b6, N-terminal domain protein [Sulfolobus islandicus L.D.8.5]
MRSKLSDWFKERLGLDDLPFFKTPDYMYKVDYWLGALVASAFIYTVITGLILLLYYNAQAGYNSTEFVINSVPYGSVVLYSHLYGAYAMIILAYVHMFRNYFAGAYKKPRELLWIIGVIMLILTLGTAFLGYSLIGDALATSAVDVGEGIISSIPGLSIFIPLLFGNYDAGDYGRVLAWHIIFTALIGLLFVFHFFMAEHYGMMPSRKVKDKVPAVYTKEEWQKFNPWWPRNFVYMMSLIFLSWGFILIIPNALAYINGLPQQLNPFLNPKPAPPPNSPAAAHITTYPPWFFLFLYKIADFTSDVVIFLFIGVIIPLIYLIIVPFLDRIEYLHPLKRKVFVGIGILMLTYLIQTTIWGDLTPGVEIPVSQQVLVYLPPAIIVALGLAAIKPKTDNKGNIKGTISPITALAFVLVSSLFVIAGIELLANPTILTVGVFISLAGIFILTTKKIAPIALKAEQRSENMTISEERVPEWKKKLAEGLVAVLFIYAIILAAQIWTIPATGYFSNLFGIDLGLIFLMLGEGISLYHYVVYRK